MTEILSSIEPLAGRYDAFLFDQFGVLHDGATAYPGVAALLAALIAANKRVMVLTNSAKPAQVNADRLDRLGVLVDGLDVFSSGEAFLGWLAGSPPARIAVVAPPGGDYGLGALPSAIVEDPAEADLLLLLQSEAPRVSMAAYEAWLAPAARRGVPAACANPDFEQVTPHGRHPAAGALAALYERLGGRVRYWGKPHRPIFEAALRRLGSPDPARTLMIGDSLHHDVRGAINAGIRSALVLTGLSADLDPALLPAMFAREHLTPTHVLRRLAPDR